MSKRFSIEAVVSMIDKVSGPMGRASKSVTGFSRKMKSSFSTVGEKAQKMNKGINRVGGRAAQVGMAGLAVGAALAAREYVKFDDAIFGATARFKAAEKPGTDMAIVMENLRKAARDMGAQTQFSATLMAQGLDKFALAGFTSAESISILKSQVELATVSGEDFMRVADVSSDLLGGFGGASLDSAAKIAKLKEMNALLAVGTLSANVTVEDLFQTLKGAGPISQRYGISMKDVIATTSILGSAGIKGGDALTAIKNIMTRLPNATGEAKRGLDKLGISQADLATSAGDLKPMTKIFDMITKKSKGMKNIEIAGIFKDLFGLRGIAGAGVMSENIGQLREQLIRMGKDPQKVMAETAAFMRLSLGNRIKALSSAATELSFKFFEAFSKDGKNGITDMTKAISKFDVKPIISGMKMFFSVIKFVYGIMKPFLPLLAAFVVVVKVLALAQAGYNAVMIIGNGLAFIWAARTGVMAVANVLLSGTFWSLAAGVVAATWPILAIVAAIGALIAVYKNWDEISGSFDASGIKTGMSKKELQAKHEKGEGGSSFFQAFGKGLQNPRFSALDMSEKTNTPATTGFASPNSRTITNNNNTQGRVDVNINDPKNMTTVEQSGIMPPTFNLATGEG